MNLIPSFFIKYNKTFINIIILLLFFIIAFILYLIVKKPDNSEKKKFVKLHDTYNMKQTQLDSKQKIITSINRKNILPFKERRNYIKNYINICNKNIDNAIKYYISLERPNFKVANLIQKFKKLFSEINTDYIPSKKFILELNTINDNIINSL